MSYYDSIGLHKAMLSSLCDSIKMTSQRSAAYETALLRAQRTQLAVYKLFGKKLKFVFKQPESGYYMGMDYYFSKLTLLNGAAKTNRVKFAGVTYPGGTVGYRAQVHCCTLGHV